MTRIAFVTWRELAAITTGDRLAAAELRRMGLTVEAAVWDDPGVAWESYAAVIIRSCWDYHLRPAEFARWLDRLESSGARVWNPPAQLRWNMDKAYLRDLQACGVVIPPTAILEPGETADLAALLARHGWERAVVKPRVSATAFNTWVTTATTAAAENDRFAALLAGNGALVQPFVDEVVADGEWSLMFFGGRYSHTVLKRAAPGDFRVQDDFGGTVEAVSAPPWLAAEARRILDCLDNPPLYARVDGVVAGGRLLLMELELIEPWLFFASDPAAPQRFAAALRDALAAG